MGALAAMRRWGTTGMRFFSRSEHRPTGRRDRTGSAAIRPAIACVALALTLGQLQSASAEPANTRFTCIGTSAAAGTAPSAAIRFNVTVPGDDGRLLGIQDEETGRTLQLAYDAEVSVGEFTVEGGTALPIIWTRLANNGGDTVGLAIGSAGDITTLRIEKPQPPAIDSAFTLLSTEHRDISTGRCSPEQS